MARPFKIAPSVLSADFASLGAAVEAAEAAGADMVHLDLMDGHFVPSLTFGPSMVKALRGHTRLPFDCHLMLEDPDAYIPDLLAAGADLISVHVEACTHLHRTVSLIRKGGAKAGVALNPHTPLPHADVIAEETDVLLLMTVNPGYGGQAFIRSVLPKFEAAVRNRKERGLAYEIEVDGGVNLETGPQVAKAGADILVAGNAIFNHRPVPENLRALRDAVARAIE